jgi:hypothetical protein
MISPSLCGVILLRFYYKYILSYLFRYSVWGKHAIRLACTCSLTLLKSVYCETNPGTAQRFELIMQFQILNSISQRVVCDISETCEICSSCFGDYENYYLLGNDAVQSRKCLPTVRRFSRSHSSGLKSLIFNTEELFPLIMEIVRSSETSVNIYRATRINISEDSNRQLRPCLSLFCHLNSQFICLFAKFSLSR